MLPVVFVDFNTPPPAACQQALEASCSAGLSSGRCSTKSALGTAEELRARAQVDFGKTDSVLVSLSANEPLTKPHYRLYFKPSDPLNDRCVTLGFVIAALLDDPESVAPSDPPPTTPPAGAQPNTSEAVGGQTKQTAPTAAKSPVPRADVSPSGTPARVPTPPAPNRRRGLVLSAGAQGMIALDSGVPQFGPALHLAYQPTHVPMQVVLLGTWGLAPEQSQSTQLQFYFVEAGLAYSFQPDGTRFAFAPSARVALEHFFAAATSAAGATDRLSRTMLGVSLGVTMSYRWSERGTVTLGTDLLRFDGGTRIEVGGIPLGSVPATNFRGFLGIGYGFL